MGLDTAILEMLEKHKIRNQKQFQTLLEQNGHAVTQPTLSRALLRLGIRKQKGSYAREFLNSVNLSVLRVIAAPPNLLVVHTPLGYADGVAIELDRYIHTGKKGPYKGILGTIAGDDTLIVIAEPSALSRIQTAIEQTFMKR